MGVYPMNSPLAMVAWHFLPDDGMTVGYAGGLPRTPVRPGLTLRHDGPLVICKAGLHASRRAIDALEYAPGSVVCRVEMRGEIAEQGDKLVARERTVLWMGDARAVVQGWACWVAEQILTAEREAGREPDARLWSAVTVTRAWLDGQATDDELASAADSARSVAYSARYAAASAWYAAASARYAADSARSVAYSARSAAASAWYAADSARYAADGARSVAYSARYAAASAQEQFVTRINDELERRLVEAYGGEA